MQVMAVGIVMIGAVILLAQILWLRHRNAEMEHRERMAALEKGTGVPAGRAAAPWSPRVYLLRGLIWTFVGGSLTLALIGVAVTTHRYHHESAEWTAMRAKQVSENLQVSIDEARQIVAKDDAERAAEDRGVPLALALFGAIPLAVGIAYLVFYYNDPSRGDLPRHTAYAPSAPHA